MLELHGRNPAERRLDAMETRDGGCFGGQWKPDSVVL